MVSGIFVEGRRYRQCFILASDTNKKDEKTLPIKLVDDCPKRSNEPNETQKQAKQIKIHQ